MSDRELKAVVSGSVSPTVPAMFKTLTDGSAKAGTAVETMGKKSGAAMRDMAKASDDSRARMDKMGDASRRLGDFLADSARASEESAAIQRQLEASVEATGHAYSEYESRLNAAADAAVKLGIDDEKNAQALQALTGATNDAGIALQYIGLVQDIAADKGRDLASVAETVGKALNGQEGALTRLGYAIDTNATAEENLAAIQRTVAGQAEAHASTLDKLSVRFGNLQETVGATAGKLAPMVALLPGLATGWNAAGSAIGAVAPNLTKMGAATGLLNLALGPAGLVAAAGAAVVATSFLGDIFGDTTLRAEDLAGAAGNLRARLGDLANAGVSSEARSNLQTYTESWQDVGRASVEALAIVEANKIKIDALLHEQSSILGNLPTLSSDEDIAAANARSEAIEAEIDALQASIEVKSALVLADKDFIQVQKDLDEVLSNSARINYPQLVARVAELDAQQQAGTITAQKQAALLHELAAGADDYGLSLDQLTGKVPAQVKGFNDVKVAIEGLRGSWADSKLGAEVMADLDTIREYGGESVKKVQDAWGHMDDTNAATKLSWQDVLGVIKATADEVDDLTAAETRRANIAEGNRQINNAQYGKPAGAFDYEAENVQVAEYQAKINASLRGMAFDEVGAAASGMGDLVSISFENMGVAAARWETNLERFALGSTSAGVALAAFGEIQDGIISGQSGFNDQVSEYGQQLNYITAAQELLNQRKEDGIQISAQEQDFLDRAAAGQGTLQNGIEGSTIALGEQALAYAENVAKGGEMNAALGENTAATGSLVGIIRDLILTMDGVPEEIRTRLELEDNATAQIGGILGQLARLDGYTVNTYVNTIESFGGGGGGNQFRNGGVVPEWPTINARNGLVTTPGGGRFIHANEAGGEDLIVPTGTLVRPAAASAEARGRSRGGREGVFNNYGTVILQPATTDVYDAMRSRALSGR